MNDLSHRQYWNDIATQWIEPAKASLWRMHSDTVNEDLVRRWYPDGNRHPVLKTDLFDEISGRGMVHLLTSLSDHAVGIDISISAVSGAAVKEPSMSGTCADIRSLPFQDKSFGSVISLSTLDHFDCISDIAKGIGELHRVLENDGCLIITLDNLMNPLVMVRALLPFSILNTLGILPYRPGKTLLPARLFSLLEEAGFRVEKTESICHVPRVIAVKLMEWITTRDNPAIGHGMLEICRKFEHLKHLPTRYLSGYFTAVRAVKMN